MSTVNKEITNWSFQESSNELDVLIFTDEIIPAFSSDEDSLAAKYRNKDKRVKEAKLIVKAVNNHSLLIEALKEVISDDKVNAILLGSTRAKIKGILNSIEQQTK